MHPIAPSWFPLSVLLGLHSTLHYSSAVISKGTLPWEIQNCYNRYSRYSLRDVVGESMCWACEAPPIYRLRTDFQQRDSPRYVAYVQNLMLKVKNEMHRNRAKRQATPRCIRREIRMLSDTERIRFLNALNILKQDGRYDMLARLHSGGVIDSAHGGPNFLSWHRFYIRLLEIELQTVDRRICLPYWDSSLDNELRFPSTSYFFSPDFVGGGGGNGPVTTGPFAGWVTPRFGPLFRNIGGGQLYSLTGINNILSQRRTRDIIAPNANPQNDIELLHNGVHVFIGGQMNNLEAAAHDPVFFLHHCFVDYLWERFRDQQRPFIDPQTDYPRNFGSPLHRPGRQMGFPGSDITAIQGYADNQTDAYAYEPSPTCTGTGPNCGSIYLTCRRNRCIPIRPQRLIRGKRAVASPGDRSRVNNDTTPRTIDESPYMSPIEIENTFCCSGNCDEREWVYVSVKVVSMRSPDLTLNSHPVYNGTVWHRTNAHHPSAMTSRFISTGHPKSYEKCNDGDGIGQIFIESQGLSYSGYYRESIIIDQRLPTSLALGYLAVKSPRKGPVKVLFRAADSCGRICKTAFKTPGAREYEPFSGVLNIADIPGLPRQYSETYEQATLNTWGYSSNSHFPNFHDEDIFVTFYCDYSEEIPWADNTSYLQSPWQRPRQRPWRSWQRTWQHQSTPPKSLPTAGQNECRIDSECVIRVPCNITLNEEFCSGDRYICEGTCNKYVTCDVGHFYKSMCPGNRSFDVREGLCVSHQLCQNRIMGRFAVPRQPFGAWWSQHRRW